MALSFPYYGTDALVYIHTTTTTVPTNAVIATTGTEYTAELKDFKITGGERDLESIKLLGFTEQANFKRASVIEVTGTLLFRDIDVWEMANGTVTTPTTSVKRTQFGEKSSSDRVPRAVFLKVARGSATSYMLVLLNGAYMKMGPEVNVTPEDAIEQTVTFQCLASSVYAEEVTL
jgi:hypothetical protein